MPGCQLTCLKFWRAKFVDKPLVASAIVKFLFCAKRITGHKNARNRVEIDFIRLYWNFQIYKKKTILKRLLINENQTIKEATPQIKSMLIIFVKIKIAATINFFITELSDKISVTSI